MHSNYSKINNVARTNEIKHDLPFQSMIRGHHKSLYYIKHISINLKLKYEKLSIILT